MKRRKFINNIFISSLGLSSISLTNPFLKSSDFPYKLSLAQFSLFRLEISGKLDPMNFAKISNELGFQGLEYLQGSYAGGLFGKKKEITLKV